MDWHAKDVHSHVRRHDEKQAVHAIAAVIEHVVHGFGLDPLAIDLEEERWQLVLALGEDDTLLVTPVINAGSLEKIADEGLIPDD